MKQKLFLTSALAMGVMAPAMAEPTNTGEFPTGGLMQEDYTYTNAATSTNMDGVYEGSVNAVAEYDIINYIVNAGQYLPADSETVITCPEGSYCPGISGNVQYNQTTPQGIETCPTGYDSSTAGASSDTQCFRTCDINNMGENGSISSIAHATAISGNDYYGAGTDTCEPTACENGYHVDSGSLDLTSLIGVSEAGNGYTSNTSTGSEDDSENMSNTIIANDPMAFAVDYGNKGIIKGHAQCSTRSATNPWEGDYDAYVLQSDSTTTTLPDSEGKYCYCQLNGYTTVGGNTTALSSPWVFGNEYNTGCVSTCAGFCAMHLLYDDSGYLEFRAVLLGSATGIGGLASCEANTITINWSDASAADISANNAGTATYGSDVRTPVKAATKKGQKFKGWRFSKPEQTDLPE